MYARCARCIVAGNDLKDDLGKRVRVTDLGSVTLYYIYYISRFIGSPGLPFGVRSLVIYDACVYTAPVPSVLPLGSSALYTYTVLLICVELIEFRFCLLDMLAIDHHPRDIVALVRLQQY